MYHIEVLPDSQLALAQSGSRANVIKWPHMESNNWKLGQPDLQEKTPKKNGKGICGAQIFRSICSFCDKSATILESRSTRFSAQIDMEFYLLTNLFLIGVVL